MTMEMDHINGVELFDRCHPVRVSEVEEQLSKKIRMWTEDNLSVLNIEVQAHL